MMKPKTSKKVLIVAMIACLAIGLVHIGFILQIYFQNAHQLPIKVDWNNADSIKIWTQDRLLHLIYQVLLISGLLNLGIGFLIWSYLRKENPGKESHETEA